MSGEAMKKTLRKHRPEVDDVRTEYQFDYSQAKPNRFASRMKQPVVEYLDEQPVPQTIEARATQDDSAH